MLSLDINLDSASTSDTLAALLARAADAEALHQAMGGAVRDRVREHLSTTKQSPNTGWWARAADSVTLQHDAAQAVVSVTQRGAALRYYGGTVSQKPGGPLLAIPSKAVPVSDQTRMAPREMGPLHYIPVRHGKPGVVAVFVQGELTGKTVQSGKRRGQPATRPRPGGSLLYVLATYTTHQPDPTVLPAENDLRAAAAEAAADYIFAAGL